MSYILEALKRAEQQRGAPARGAASLPRAIAIDFEPRARWRWVVGGLAGLAVVAGAIAFWPSQEPTVVTPPAPVTAPASAVVAPAPAPTPTVGSAPLPAPAVASTPPPVEVAPPIPPRAEPAPPARAAGPRPGAVVKPAVSPVPVARSAAPRAPSPAVEERTASRAPSPVPSPAPAVEPPAMPPVIARAAPPRVVSPEPAPVPAPAGNLAALAAKLSIQVLSWAPERRDRFVFFGGRKYSEGQVVDDKFLIEQITEDGVVLSYQGERLTLKGR